MVRFLRPPSGQGESERGWGVCTAKGAVDTAVFLLQSISEHVVTADWHKMQVLLDL